MGASHAEGEALRRLIEKWRQDAKYEAARLADSTLNPTAMVATFNLCADELEAALAPLSGPVDAQPTICTCTPCTAAGVMAFNPHCPVHGVPKVKITFAPGFDGLTGRPVMAYSVPAGPVDASGEPRKILTAPCRWCGYNGPSYWSEGTHATTCPWRKIGGEVNRLAVLADHPVEAMRAAAVPSSPDLTATLRALAIYCFQKHGNDAYLYNALADLVGPEAMRAVPSSPAQEKK